MQGGTTVKCVSEDKENIFEFEGLTFNGQLETQVPLIIECPEIYYSKGGQENVDALVIRNDY